MALKIAGSLLLVLSGFGIGWMMSKRLQRRVSFLQAFLRFLSALGTAMRYQRGDLSELIISCSDETVAFQNLESGMSFIEWWKASVERFRSAHCLTDKELKLLNDFGEGLGKTDLEGQLSHLSLFIAAFEEQLTRVNEEISSKSRMYRSLGLFAGLSLAIVLI